MTVLAAQMRPRWDAAVGWLAGATGTALRLAGRSLPGVAGPLIVAAGLWMVYRPLGVIFAGAVVWALDRRV